MALSPVSVGITVVGVACIAIGSVFALDPNRFRIRYLTARKEVAEEGSPDSTSFDGDRWVRYRGLSLALLGAFLVYHGLAA